MTLARKTIVSLSALTLGTVATAGAAIWGLAALQQQAQRASTEYESLQQAHQLQRQLAAVLENVSARQREAAWNELTAALEQTEDVDDAPPAASKTKTLTAPEHWAHSALAALLAQRAAPSDESVSAAQRALSQLVDERERSVSRMHSDTAAIARVTLVILVGLSVVILLGLLVISLHYYASVIEPLTYVRQAVRQITHGELETRLAPRGDEEFVELQRDFNSMAGELQGLYRNLEQRVAEQSRQLALSERLASVGFLAAGIGHEINNPIAIMSGYAESLLRRLSAAENRPEMSGVRADLEIIRDEAFRCKRITDELLVLARGGHLPRSKVSLWKIIDDVIAILRLSMPATVLHLETRGDRNDPLWIWAAEPELKQVVLNLALNAAHAVPRHEGRIEFAVARENGWVQVAVRDNGVGMTRETIDHAFEPFFTTRAGAAGTGLGLAISHAIVRAHEGVLSADSDGLGKGSVFTLRIRPLNAEAA